PLVARLEEAQVTAILQQPNAGSKPAAAPPQEIEHADFARLALKVGKVLTAERVPKADKLLQLSVELGEGAPRTIVAGIAEAYAPEAVVGRNVVVVANLKPRVLRGITSQGMLLTAGPGGANLALIDPGSFPPGTAVT